MTKRNCNVKMNCVPDRLSELPDSLVFEIFQFLAMTDVVRTTILSKRWKNLWTTCPYLDLDDSKMMMDTDKIGKLIDGVVNSWRGTKILKFSVEFRKYRELLDSWVRFATERKVEELKLYVPMKFVVPQFVYSCSSLKKILLTSCDLQVDGNVQWYGLKRLLISGEGFSEHAINQVMLGSPQLESFYFFFLNMNENLSIRSSSLRSLIIHMLVKRDAKRDGGVISPELRIWTPNLEELAIGGAPHVKCVLMNVPSLTKVSLLIYGSRILFPGTEFVGDRLSRILPSIKHVPAVALSEWCIKALAAMKDKHMLSPFPIAHLLKLKVCSQDCQQIVSVLEMFPNLSNLLLRPTYERTVPQHAETSLHFNTNLPNLFLLQLRTLDVTWTGGDDSIFPLMRFLLKYATNLEKIVFSLEKGDKSPASWRALASQKLLQMSPTAELIFS